MLRIILILWTLGSYKVAFSQKVMIETQLNDIQGNNFNILNKIDQSKPTILSFWASWCKPCLEEISALEKIIKQENYPVNFIKINTDDVRTLGRAKSLAKQKKWTDYLYFDTNKDFMRKMGVSNLPHTFIYNKNRTLIRSFNSYIKGDEEAYFELLK